MNVSRSGYYKWLKQKEHTPNYILNQIDVRKLIRKIHKDKPTKGYRSIAKTIRDTYGWYVSDNYVHKNCKAIGIQSVVRRKRYKQLPGDKHNIYRNLVKNSWNTSRPFEVLCTDTTLFKHKNILYDLTIYMDTFNNEIISYDLSKSKHGSDPLSHNRALIKALETKIKRGYKDLKTIFHSDQGVIYASQAFAYAYKDYNIEWSMSRAGTPTDNPKIESFNGWIKGELINDFEMDKCEDIFKLIEEYVYYFNNERYAYSLQYKNPIQYKTELGYE